MTIIFNILVIINIFFIVFLISKYIIENYKYIKLKLKSNIETTKFANLIDDKIKYLVIYNGYKNNKFLTSITIFLISIIFSVITYFL